jgi:LL-diaminopimelate aminotransferase
MRKVIIDSSERLQQVGPTELVALERIRNRMIRRGIGVLDLGRFDPDLPIDPELLAYMQRALTHPDALRLVRHDTAERFKVEAARWFEQRFGVKLRPRTGLLPTGGIKQAVYFLAQAIINPGDQVGIPDPSYGLYRAAAVFAGGVPQKVELRSANDYLPNLARLDQAGVRPRVLFLNYPHNPTSTPPERAFLVDLVRWARKHNVLIVHDFAYGEIYFGAERPISILNIPGARQVAVELHSFSFTYSLAGLKLGFAVGNPEVLAALEGALTNLTSGINNFRLNVGAEALRRYEAITGVNNAAYAERREVVAHGLEELGWSFRKPIAGPFFWVHLPRRDDVRLARRFLTRAHVLVAPGSAFGEEGEGYLRFSVARNPETITTAFGRLGRLWPQRLRQMRDTWGPSDSSA